MLFTAILPGLAGCAPVWKKADSPLAPARMMPDSVGLEIFFVRFPFDDPQVNRDLWKDIDEQHFPPDLRQRLAQNGFRVGLVAGSIPSTLVKLLELPDKPPPTPDQSDKVVINEMAEDPRVVQRQLQLRAGRRGEIVASGIYDQLPIVQREQGEVTGRIYAQAQGVLAVKPALERDGRVRLEIVPELQYGQPQQRWVGDHGMASNQGMLRLETARPKKTFDQISLAATLAPGDMLVLTSLPERRGSIGHHFLTTGTDRLEQKLLIIRLAQTQHDDVLAPPQALHLDE